MILCRECGNSAPSKDGFCSACGALLAWSGEQVNTQVLPTVPSTAPTSTTPLSTTPVSTTPPPTTSRVYGSAAAAGDQTPIQPRPRPEPVASSGWIPTPETPRPDPVPVASEPEYTGPYCQVCGARNPEGRQFCRVCAATLQLPAGESASRRGWWRRLWDRLRGRREFNAGERPSNFRDHATGATPRKRKFKLPRYIKPGRFAPILIIAGLAGIGLGPARGWVTTEVGSLLGKAKSKVDQHYVNVTPVGAKANAEPGHAAGLAIDGVNTTYWASAQHPDGTGDSITVTFSSPVDIDQIGILSGADPADFRASARPHDLTVSSAGMEPVTLSIEDSPDFQNRPATLRNVTTVTITVKDSYPGQKKHDLAIRDLEFFVKSS
jgi:ribosomal protein L40E